MVLRTHVLMLATIRKLQGQVQKLEDRLKNPAGSATTARLQAEKSNLKARIEVLDTDLEQIQERIDQRQGQSDGGDETLSEETANKRMPNESQRDFLIRTGKITPFSKMAARSLPRSGSNLQDVLFDAEEGDLEEPALEDLSINEPLSHRNLLQPGFLDDAGSETTSEAPVTPEWPSKRRRLEKKTTLRDEDEDEDREEIVVRFRGENGVASGVESDDHDDHDDAAFVSDMDDRDLAALGDSEEEDKEDQDEDEEYLTLDTPGRKRKIGRSRKKVTSDTGQVEDLTGLDDGNEKLYQSRLQSWVRRRSAARNKATARRPSVVQLEETLDGRSDSEDHANRSNLEIEPEKSAEPEWYMPHPTQPDTELEGGYRIAGDIYPSLFDYQKTGVQWLWELYSQQVGGIIGDEMGLGKTIQAIAFLAGLHYSKKITKPIIVVCPATVMKQWVNEFHTWWPPFRVSILHTSGSGMIDVGREAQIEDDLMLQTWDKLRQKTLTKGHKAAKRIVDRVVTDGHVLVTTYSGLQTYATLLIPVDWEYAILDEGHKIRNPDTVITIHCKELRTANRIILSGTPMQNNLIELWSLFDFIFPMRLGTLVNFRQQFEFPIRQGGYASASNLQVQTAMKCAETLKDTISPYLLQRFKVDVAADLPKKSEQVLFCKLTRLQREAYEKFLSSDDMKAIMNRKRRVLFGVDILRKICNHPDLQDHRSLSVKPGYIYGSGAKSGKMQVVKALLELWRDTGHKTLLFAQHRIMLDILEKFIKSLGEFNYRRMDGNTPIPSRQAMVDEFNQNPDVHVFLLTTKVGGLGINLTGADRVIIYDPDWNPSTDIQARERAWRLGQKREVMIYRLMTAGTIEEKIYHRQIFKQFLTNKILKDPKQRQTFQMKDLHDLFTLGSESQGPTETGELFQGTEVKFGSHDASPPPAQAIDAPTWGGDSPAQKNVGDDPSSVRGLAGVASLERFYGDDQERKATSADGTNSEARVMEGIFARSGVHSALEHDQIINGKRIITADPKIIEREAKKVAAQAADELKKAGEIARTVPVGTPTWTGQSGTAGRPDPQGPRRGSGRGAGRGGPASSAILAGLQNRQATNSLANGSRTSTPASRGCRQSTPGMQGKDFMRLIRDYLITHDGMAHTQMLIDHFNRYCNTPERTAEFKEMLKTIAKLEKGSRGRGKWVLKEEYKG